MNCSKLKILDMVFLFLSIIANCLMTFLVFCCCCCFPSPPEPGSDCCSSLQNSRLSHLLPLPALISLPTKQCVLQKTVLLTFNSLDPSYLIELLSPYEPIHSLNLADVGALTIPVNTVLSHGMVLIASLSSLYRKRATVHLKYF